ncbi:hypothetical protein C8J57DRAFT_1232425 [Mycena rebaudengoi]|nr:hypothetical protein C8J57DRAFT_1232425 [Mycena rebaudengoi]
MPSRLDTVPVVAGTVFSIALLVSTPILAGSRPTVGKRKKNIDFDTLGVLETVWLAGSDSAVTAVETPSTKDLRKAGMLVEISGCHWRGGEHPQLAGSESPVPAVEMPSTKHLRKAGMLVEISGYQ